MKRGAPVKPADRELYEAAWRACLGRHIGGWLLSYGPNGCAGLAAGWYVDDTDDGGEIAGPFNAAAFAVELERRGATVPTSVKPAARPTPSAMLAALRSAVEAGAGMVEVRELLGLPVLVAVAA